MNYDFSCQKAMDFSRWMNGTSWHYVADRHLLLCYNILRVGASTLGLGDVRPIVRASPILAISV